MKKEIGKGFLVGLICNVVGIVLTVFIISTIKNTGFENTFRMYLESSNLWMIISLGALPNLAAFFGFLRINREYRARGVLLATFLAAITTYLIYFF
ncbi:hypothetical protein [Patiriisocius hiemis]|uniref:Uncharacterized protein n=1 Tax=Patiriisocius hiemis TaxID=3075604 RepID=A0ABU2YF20_9FLAO|nr:hypothetical protein [Constantimarinum sp. W242]MDT0556259.1 hypothetical protein [Constantimarinum sp. W242]